MLVSLYTTEDMKTTTESNPQASTKVRPSIMVQTKDPSSRRWLLCPDKVVPTYISSHNVTLLLVWKTRSMSLWKRRHGSRQVDQRVIITIDPPCPTEGANSCMTSQVRLTKTQNVTFANLSPSSDYR